MSFKKLPTQLEGQRIDNLVENKNVSPTVETIKEENQNPTPATEGLNPSDSAVAESSPLDPPEAGRQGDTVEKAPNVLFKSEIEESPEEQLQKRIAVMEEEEKKKEEEEKKKMEENNKKEAEAQKKLSGSFEGFGASAGSLPKYQELFKSPTAKLPPLPKFQPTMQKEPVIPQPPQLAKKPKSFKFVFAKEPAIDFSGTATITFLVP